MTLLDTLAAKVGGERHAVNVARIWSANAQARMAALETAAAAACIDDVLATSHTLRGASSMLGIDSVAESCSRLESVAERPDADVSAVRELVGELLAEVRAVVAELQLLLPMPG